MLLALAVPLSGQAQDRQSLSLEEALQITMTNNPAIAAADYNIRSAEQERKAAIGLRMPRIGVTGAYAYLGKDIGFDFNGLKAPVEGCAGQLIQSGLIPPALLPTISEMLSGALNRDWMLTLQDRSLGFVGGDVTLPVYMGGKINAANRAARINVGTATAEGVQQRNALVSELVERYFGLALARQVVDVRRQAAAGIRRHLDDAIALEKEGIIAHSERLYVEFRMAEAERELQNAELQLATISSALNNTLGCSDGAYSPASAMFIVQRIEDLAYFRDIAADKNPLLNQVELKRRLAVEGVRLQRSAFLPQVVAMGGASFYNYQVTDIMPRWAVGVGVSLKLFDGLNREYKYSAAKQTVRRVEALQQKAGEDIAVLVEKLYNQMLNYANQMGSIEASLAFAGAYLKTKDAAFREGLCSASDLIDAELNLAKIRTERMQAAYQYDVLLARLLEAAGISQEFVRYSRRPDARQIHFE